MHPPCHTRNIQRSGACNEFTQHHLVRMGILDSAKEIADLVKKIGDIELYRKIVELEGQLIELTHEKREFEERCDRLEKQLAFSKTLTFKAPVYYAEGDSTPYCPICWEKDAKALHLEGPTRDDGDTFYRCHVCDNVFFTQRGLRHTFGL